MRTKALNSAKLIIKVSSKKDSSKIYTDSVYDNRTKNFWTNEQITERGIVWFLDFRDMVETLNWNLNGDSKKFQFKWYKTIQNVSHGYAYIFH